MYAKRRNHHYRDDSKVEKHGERLAPCVFPKTLRSREPGTHEQPQSHPDFQEQNQVGGKWSRRSKESFVQQISPRYRPPIGAWVRMLRGLASKIDSGLFGRNMLTCSLGAAREPSERSIKAATLTFGN